MPSEELDNVQSENDTLEFVVGEEISEERLDKFVSENTPEWVSRSVVQSAIKDKKIRVNGKPKKQSYKVKPGDMIHLDVPKKPEIKIEPENIPIDIIYEDDSIIVINKAPDMIVHPVPNVCSGTLVNALLFHFSQFKEWEEVQRPGIVHRLDKNTSGAMIIAKTEAALKKLSEQFHDRKNHKEYITIVEGAVKNDRGQIEKPLARHIKNRVKMTVDFSGKYALSQYKVIKRFSELASLVMVEIKTGRTHQIRVHMRSIGNPVLGDGVYSFRNTKAKELNCKRQMLHALKLGIFHPVTGEWMEFIAKLPDDFKNAIKLLSSLSESSESSHRK
ncbi:MAG: RluA family pseudouridine synthase [Thermotogota bacterium]|nr:RluA family pseudouridine synthase [Thermotogota bacterium]